ncbi:MAG: transglutaminase domain-containing protein [Candidatus Omnitrophota bacterium]
MTKGRIILLIFAISLSLVSAGVYFLSFGISEKIYDKAMCYYIARHLTDGADTFEEKIASIRGFVHENVHPIAGYPNRLDTVGIEKLTSGIGWCDQQSRVFMEIASGAGIATRLLFLKIEGGASPHTVAEALAPDGRWVIVDTGYDLDLRNRSGSCASQDEIRMDPAIVSENEKVRRRAPTETRWADGKYLSIYANTPEYIVTRKRMKFDILKAVPLSWIRPFTAAIKDRYLDRTLTPLKDIYASAMVRARGYQLLGHYKKSDALYEKIIASSGDYLLARKAEFYYALSLKERNMHSEALGYITDTLRTHPGHPYLKYLYRMRASIFDGLGRREEAEADLAGIGYDLDA